MANLEPPLTLGLEEEYLLVDLETRAVASEPPHELFAALHDRTGGRAFPEFLRSQVEVATPICRNVADARSSLVELRRAVVEECARYGLAPIAAGSTRSRCRRSRSELTRSVTSRCSRRCRASRGA